MEKRVEIDSSIDIVYGKREFLVLFTRSRSASQSHAESTARRFIGVIRFQIDRGRENKGGQRLLFYGGSRVIELHLV